MGGAFTEDIILISLPPPPTVTFLLQKIPTGSCRAVTGIVLHLEKGFSKHAGRQLPTTAFRGRVKLNQ